MKNFALYLFYFSLLVLPSICNAQSDSMYYDKDWKSCGVQQAYYYRIIQTDSNGKYKVTDRYILNNQMQMTGYSSKKDTLIYDGHFTYYKENGQVSEEGDYTNNIQSGEWKYYYADTNALLWTCTYSHGKLDRKLLNYYKSGKLKRKENYLEGEFLSGKKYDETGTEVSFTPFRSMPEFNGDYNQFIMRNLHYPYNAIESNKEGRVLVRFVVDTDGTIENVTIAKSVFPSLDNEALRLVKAMPKWKPGTQDDKPIKAWYTLPLVFKLQ